MSARLLLDRLVAELPKYSYAIRDEKQLHDGIAAVLAKNDVLFEREHIAGPLDRFDFLLPGGLVLEAKIKGTWSQALRQVDRYCQRVDVTGVLLVTTRLWGHVSSTRTIALRGKPVRVVHLGGQAF